MPKQVIVHELNDWSEIKSKDSFWAEIDQGKGLKNFDIHTYHGKMWTSGYVGVGRLFNSKDQALKDKNKEHVVVIKSSYNLDPWNMLKVVMGDDEYADYLENLTEDKTLFKVFYDQPLIKLEQSTSQLSDVLYAVSFISNCYILCRKGLKHSMNIEEKNYNAKVRGRIDIHKNIRLNSTHGRDDRFYCKFISFTIDNLENRILKDTLSRCKKILVNTDCWDQVVEQRYYYCANCLKGVKSTKVTIADFNNVSVGGLYMYYKPVIKQARCIYNQKYFSYKSKEGMTVSKSTYTIPYCINMELLFELYARAVLRKHLDSSKYELVEYSEHVYLEKGVTGDGQGEKGVHLIEHCIPDMIIREKCTNNNIAVLDAKYKQHDRTAREDSHQLMSYVLLTGIKRCGFIFPGDKACLKSMSNGDDYLKLNTPLIGELRYYELILGKEPDEKLIEQILT